MATMFAMLMGSMFLLPVFMQELQGLPATEAGLALLPRTIAMMVVSPLIGRSTTASDRRPSIALGVVLFMVGSLAARPRHRPRPRPVTSSCRSR